jgi:hypothetical protein
MLMLLRSAGGSHEGYCKGVCSEACGRGWRAVVLNYRGCNGLRLATPRGYCAASTDDVHTAVVSTRRYASAALAQSSALAACPASSRVLIGDLKHCCLLLRHSGRQPSTSMCETRCTGIGTADVHARVMCTGRRCIAVGRSTENPSAVARIAALAP